MFNSNNEQELLHGRMKKMQAWRQKVCGRHPYYIQLFSIRINNKLISDDHVFVSKINESH